MALRFYTSILSYLDNMYEGSKKGSRVRGREAIENGPDTSRGGDKGKAKGKGAPQPDSTNEVLASSDMERASVAKASSAPSSLHPIFSSSLPDSCGVHNGRSQYAPAAYDMDDCKAAMHASPRPFLTCAVRRWQVLRLANDTGRGSSVAALVTQVLDYRLRKLAAAGGDLVGHAPPLYGPIGPSQLAIVPFYVLHPRPQPCPSIT